MTTNENVNRSVAYVPWLGFALILAGAAVTAFTRSFDLANNLMLAGGALLLIIFAIARPDEVRELLTTRTARYGLSTVLSILFFAAIAILLFWLAYQNDDWRWDVTETGEFTPPPETVEMLQDLEEPVHVIGFYTIGLTGQREQARTILETLAAESDEITFEFADPEANPLLAEQYELNFDGTLVFIRNQGQEDEVFARANSLSDRDIHAALLKIVNPVAKKLYLVTGHGEPATDSVSPEGIGTMVSLLEDQGFTVEELSLFTTETVPEDATVVALIGPQAPLDPVELAALRTYLASGGAAFIARDVVGSEAAAQAEADGLNDYLAESWGLALRSDVIIDQDLARAGQTFGLDFLAAQYGSSPIVTEELQQFGTRFSLARSIDVMEAESTTATPLALTSPNAWGETDFATVNSGVPEPGDADATGVLNIGVAAEKVDTGARLVLFGDADFVRNNNLVWGGNSLFFTNSLNWLAADEVSIELTPRENIQRQVNFPEQQLRALRWVSILFGPLLMGAVGVIVWYSRRSRR